jgi:hypothetical protein
MLARYTPFLAPDRRTWVIFDWQLFGYCTLPADGAESTLLPLEWRTRAAADGWLQRCYLMWQRWEKEGGGAPPEDWRPRPERISPYDNGLPLPPATR